MMDPFENIELDPDELREIHKKKENKDPFDEIEYEESLIKSMARKFLQVPLGGLQGYTWPADIIQMMGVGEALDPEELDQIRRISEMEGIPFDEEKYFENVQLAASSFPTQSNIERAIENKTGLPLQPKTKLERGLRLSGTAAKFAGPSLTQKIASGVAAPVTSAGLQAVGVPEPVADIAGLGLGNVASSVVPAGSLVKKIGESGLPVRRFEKLKKPTVVSEHRLNKINEKIESDFRNVSDKIIKKSSLKDTYKSLQKDPLFITRIGEGFEEVEKIAQKLTKIISTKKINSDLVNLSKSKKGKGFVPSEYEKAYRKKISNLISETEKEHIKAPDLVGQFRKNNSELREIFEPGQSKGYNRSKVDALLDHNEVIANTIVREFPESSFGELFTETNKQWSQIKNIEMINDFLGDMFKGKIDFKKGISFFEKQNQNAFKKALGDEAFNDFKTLMNDFIPQKRALALIKTSKNKGVDELAKTASLYLFKPEIAASRYGFQKAKSAFQMLLDKPELTIKWDKGIKAVKQEKFKDANKIFTELENQRVSLEESRINALKKFNARKTTQK